MMKQRDRFFSEGGSSLKRGMDLQLEYGDISKIDMYRFAYETYLREKYGKPIRAMKRHSIRRQVNKFPFRTNLMDIMKFTDWMESEVESQAIND